MSKAFWYLAHPPCNFVQTTPALRGAFPEGKACLIASNNDADPVAHASLIFHQHCYNPRMGLWLQKLHNQPLLAVV